MTQFEMGLASAFGILVLLLGAFWSVVRAKIDKAEERSEKSDKQLSDFKYEIATKYASLDDIKQLETSISRYFETMNNKLDNFGKEIKSVTENFRDRLDRKQDRKPE